MNTSHFTPKVIEWYRLSHRNLPWRETRDPYKIWLSEIILQQTRVDQGLDYYRTFVRKFPAVEDLAAADEQEVLKLWQGLGYYSRARNLHYTARDIVNNYGGKFPEHYKALKALKGVGDYTAAAIASFAFKEAVAAVDGNVYRVLSRFFGIATPIDTGAGKKEFATLAQSLISPTAPDDFNQATMELGAIICTPKTPNCAQCPIATNCAVQLRKDKLDFPFKSKRIKVKPRYFHYLVDLKDQNITLEQRIESKDIWHKMFQFPLIEMSSQPLETAEDIDKVKNQISALIKAQKPWEAKQLCLMEPNPTIHKLSHQHLHVWFWTCTFTSSSDSLQRIQLKQLTDYPLPQLIAQALDRFVKS